MKRLFLCALVAIFSMAPVTFADPILQDWGFNIDGTWYPDQTTNTSGLDLSGWDWVDTGLGTITFTTTSGGNFDAWIFDPVSIPAFNEYGTTSGTPVSGQTWQIDIPDYLSDSNHTGTIIANTQADTLSNTNYIPGTADNFPGTCSTGSDCNDYTSLAMGFDFSAPPSGYEDVITLTLSQTPPPGGFYLEQIHPVDDTNNSASNLYLWGTLTTEKVGGQVPEPKTSVFLGALLLLIAICFRRKLASARPIQ